jgi:hypothetical protein
MVDPDNEERLLKIPLRVVAVIQAEAEQRVLNEYRQQHDGISEAYFQQIRNDALRDAVDVVWKVPAKARHEDDGLISLLYDKGEIVAAIDGLSNPNETSRASDSHQPQIDGTEAHDER